MLPLLEKEVVDKKCWLTHAELLDVYALGQSTPGVIALNVSTFVGVRQGGLPGGIFATVGMLTPSLFIISVLAGFIGEIEQYPIVLSIFSGVRAVVAGLLLSSVYKLLRNSVKDFAGVLILMSGFALITFGRLSPVLIVLASGVAGIFLYGIRGVKQIKDKD